MPPIVAKLKTMPFFRALLLSVDRIIRRTRHMTLPGCRRVSIYDFCIEFYESSKGGNIWQRAKGLSYSLLMAMPPLLIFFFSLIAYFPVENICDMLLFQLYDVIPQRFYDRVAYVITDVMLHKHTDALSLSFITSVFLAAVGIYGMLRSMNYANTNIERRPFLPVFGISMLLVVVLYVVMLLVIVLMIGYRYIIDALLHFGVFHDTAFIMFLIQFGRWFIMLLLVLSVLAVLYYFAQGKTLRDLFRRKPASSNQEPAFGLFAPGSLLATTLFFILTWFMQIYLNHFNNFSLLYGSVGTILMIMLWLFMNCWVLLIGYQINVSIIGGLKHHKYALVPRRKDKISNKK